MGKGGSSQVVSGLPAQNGPQGFGGGGIVAAIQHMRARLQPGAVAAPGFTPHAGFQPQMSIPPASAPPMGQQPGGVGFAPRGGLLSIAGPGGPPPPSGWSGSMPVGSVAPMPPPGMAPKLAPGGMGSAPGGGIAGILGRYMQQMQQPQPPLPQGTAPGGGWGGHFGRMGGIFG